MFQKRGQAGIEYVILVGLLLFFFIPLIHYSFQETNNSIKESQLDSFIGRLSKGVETVHSIGPGSKEIIVVTLPRGIQEANLINGEEGSLSEIVLKVEFRGGVSDIHATVKPRIFGTLPTSPGTYHLRLVSLNETSVNISIN